MTRRQRRLQEKRQRHGRHPKGRQLAVGAGATVGATLLMGGVANAANVTVDSLADAPDPGHTTLRDALHTINTSPPADSHITFASGLSGTINLNSELAINYPVSIQGPGAGQLTISGQDSSRTFYLEGLTDGFDVSISGLTLSHGKAIGTVNDRNGGAIFNYNADLTVSSSVLTLNTAAGTPGTDGFGGAICSCDAHAGALNIVNSTLSGNTATSNGGAVYSDHAPVSIEGVTINGNKARSGGGGLSIYNPDGPSTVKNSTIAGNTLTESDHQGGGVYWFKNASGIRFDGVTISGNSADHGGGIYFFNQTGSVPIVLHNSIVANNSAGVDGPDLFGPFDSAFSLIKSTANASVTDTVPGSDIIGQDPQLGTLAANGGPTQTMKPALTSPAIDKGAAFGLTTDQRGSIRPVEISTIPNSGAPGADGSDIGAYELPSNVFKIKKVKDRKLVLMLPSAGEVQVTDAKSKKRSADATVSKSKKSLKTSQKSGGPGKLKVKLILTKAAAKKLRQVGKLKLKAAITFSPTGGWPATKKAKLKLKQ